MVNKYSPNNKLLEKTSVNYQLLDKNSTVKRVWTKVVTGWVTSWEVIGLNPF